VRGLLLVLFGAAVAAAAGIGFLALAGLFPGSWIIEVVLIAALLGQGTVFMEGLRPGVSGTAVNNDLHQIVRDRVEALAHGFITYAVAPIF
jgi:hypothetical protein